MTDLKIGITGFTGYLGSNIVQFLHDKGYSVRCLARKIPEKNGNENIEYIEGDILDPESLVPFIEGLDVCIHLAAFVGVGTKSEYRRVNFTGSKNLCDTILDINPECRFVYCSSIAVFKQRKVLGFLDTQYAKSKSLGQKYAVKLRENKGLKLTIVYSGMIYGRNDKRFLPSVIRYLSKRQLILLSGGETDSPLIYIDDLCDLFYKISKNPDSANKDYFGVKHESKGIHQFFRLLAEKKGLPIPGKKLPKLLLLIPAMLIEDFWRFFQLPGKPPLSRRTADVLSINLKLPESAFRNNLDWVAETDMNKGLDKALEVITQN